MKNLLLTGIVFLAGSCGLVLSDQRLLHNQYAGILSSEDKKIVIETGEGFKDLEYDDPNRHIYSKGRLRILKTERANLFNFVKVGQWIEHGRYGNSGSRHNLEFRDTLTYDNNGNTTRRIVYDKKYDTFQLTNSWVGEIVDDSFIQRMQVYDGGILVAEYSRKIINYLTPKSDLEKVKIRFGEEKAYSNGKLISVKTYDSKGNLVSDKEYGR